MTSYFSFSHKSILEVGSGFEIFEAEAANRIDRKNEIDAVPAISPYIRFGVKLSPSISPSLTPKRIYGDIAGRRSPFLCYSFEQPKKSLLILPDSSVCVHRNSTSIALPPNSNATHSAYMGQTDPFPTYAMIQLIAS